MSSAPELPVEVVCNRNNVRFVDLDGNGVPQVYQACMDYRQEEGKQPADANKGGSAIALPPQLVDFIHNLC